MGFWSTLGKVASYAAPIVAAPFTGGLSTLAIGAGAGAARAALEHKGAKGILGNAALGAAEGVAADKFMPNFGGNDIPDIGNVNSVIDRLQNSGSANAQSIAAQLQAAMKDPKKWAQFAPLLPALMAAFGGGGGGGGGNNPFSDSGLTGEIKDSLAMQRKRMEQAQPVYDTLVNMSYGMSPTRYRGASAPEGYKANGPPQGPYQYEGPRFG